LTEIVLASLEPSLSSTLIAQIHDMQDKRNLMLFALQLPSHIKLPKAPRDGRTEAWLIGEAQVAYQAAGHLLDCCLPFSFILDDGSVDWTFGVGCYTLEVTKEKLVLIRHRKINALIKAPVEVTPANMHQWRITSNWHESMAELTNATVNKSIKLKIWAAGQAVISPLADPSTPPAKKARSTSESAEKANFQAEGTIINLRVNRCGSAITNQPE
jgi:hypothetical protein